MLVVVVLVVSCTVLYGTIAMDDVRMLSDSINEEYKDVERYDFCL